MQEQDRRVLRRQGHLYTVMKTVSDRYFSKPGNLTSLEDFMSKNQITEAIVTSKSVSGVVDYKGKQLLFMPSALYCYLVGHQTISKV